MPSTWTRLRPLPSSFPPVTKKKPSARCCKTYPISHSRLSSSIMVQPTAPLRVARRLGACVVSEPRRGYGQACLTGMAHLDGPDIVVFLDGDYSDYPEDMLALVRPIIADGADMVIGSRVLGQREKGALLPQARFGQLVGYLLNSPVVRRHFYGFGAFSRIALRRAHAARDAGSQLWLDRGDAGQSRSAGPVFSRSCPCAIAAASVLPKSPARSAVRCELGTKFSGPFSAMRGGVQLSRGDRWALLNATWWTTTLTCPMP